MAKLTRAQTVYLHDLVRNDGFLRRRYSRPWTFFDRMANAGLIEIVPYSPESRGGGFPIDWEGERITDAGRAAISSGKDN